MPFDLNDLSKYDNPPAEQRVRAFLGADTDGQMQVIAPESALVDPASIKTSTARELRSLPESTDTTISAIPGFYGLPSVVHTSLKRQRDLALSTEVPGQYVRVTGEQLAQLCGSHDSFEAQFCDQPSGTPADTTRDLADITHAVESFTTRRIEARLDETLHIPPLPETARKIMALQAAGEFDLSELVQIVETDPSIAARIMGWANSAFYGTTTPSKTIHDAINRVLGADMVFNMALGLAIGKTLALPHSHVAGANPYWLDALYTAATCEALAKHSRLNDPMDPGLAYLTGLLANFGTLVVGHVFPPQYETICRLQEANPQLPYGYVDQYVLMVNREVIASTLLEQWELPDEICTAVRHQQVADYVGPHQSYVDVLKLSQDLVRHENADLTDAQSEAAALLGISTTAAQEVNSLVTNAHEAFDDLARGMSR